MPSSSRTLLLSLISTLLGTPLLVEAAYRYRPLPITVQLIDLAVVDYREVDGQVLWTEPAQALQERDFEGCHERHPHRPVVVMLGSSILASSGLRPPDTVRDAVQNAVGEVCVRNLARPGFNFAQQAASLTAARHDHPIDLLVVELWSNSPKRYTRMGRRLATLDGLELRDGLPVGRGWVPPPLHRALLTWSHSYQHLTVVTTPRASFSTPAMWADLAERAEAAAAQWPDVPVLAYGAPGLRPARLAEWAPGSTLRASYDRVAERIGADRVLHGADLFTPDELPSIRRDPCCHYNEEGVKRVGDALAPAITELLAGVEASGSAPPSR